jgi:hypothetical protein
MPRKSSSQPEDEKIIVSAFEDRITTKRLKTDAQATRITGGMDRFWINVG